MLRLTIRSAVLAMSLLTLVSPLGGCADDSSGDSGLGAQAANLCGNGVVDREERCDDGNRSGGDGCTQYCEPEYGFTCEGAVCSSVCGDGVKAGDEGCDDPKTPDYCSAACKVVGSCGDGVLQPVEACDPKLAVGCTSLCKPHAGFSCDAEAATCKPDSELPVSTAIDKMSAAQKTQFCEWLTTAIGGVGSKTTCGSTQYTILSVGNCVSSLPFDQWPGCSFDEMATWIAGTSACTVLTEAPPCIGK